MTHECSECGTVEEHTYTETVEEATCANAGAKIFTCACGDSYSEEIPVLSHVDEDENSSCDICGNKIYYTGFTLTRTNYKQAGIVHSGDVVIPKTFVYNGVYYKTGALDASAFDNCYNVTSIVVPNNITKIQDYTFRNCSKMTSINIPGGIRSIGTEAFRQCKKLTSIEIPIYCTSIGEYAFLWCSSLTELNIPAHVTSIGAGAFQACSGLESIIVNENNFIYDSRNNCNALIETDTNTLIAGCKNTIIPDSITSIGFAAFAWCSDLTSIEIPDSVTSIDGGAFSYCTGLTNISLPDSVTKIGGNAFCECTSLTNVTIPASVTDIGTGAFSSCGNLTINYEGTEEQWEEITKGTDWSKNSTPTIVYNYTE